MALAGINQRNVNNRVRDSTLERLPPSPAIPKRKMFGMQNFSKDFERFREPRPWPVKILVVGHIDLPLADGLQIGPPRFASGTPSPPDFARCQIHRQYQDNIGSAAASASHVIQGECFPASPNRLIPPAISTSSGIQLPAAINGSIHSMQATRGRDSSVARDHIHAAFAPANPRSFRTGRVDTAARGHVGNIAPHIDEGIGPQ